MISNKKIPAVMIAIVMMMSILSGVPQGDVKGEAASSAVTIRIKKSDVSGRSFTKVVQQALDTASKNATAKRPYIIKIETDGKLTDSLHIFSNTTIDLTGHTITNQPKNTKAKQTVRNMIVCGYSKNTYSAGYDSFKNISFVGGTWNGNAYAYRASDAGSCMMRFGHITNLTFKNVTLKNALNVHHVEIASANGIRFTGCSFENMRITNSAAGSHVALQLDTNHAESNFPGYKPHDDLGCNNVTLTNTTFKNVERGFGSDHVVFGKYYENIKVSKCRFINNSGRGITAYSWKNSSVKNCTFTNVGEGIRCATKLSNVTYANSGYYKNNPKYNYNAMMKIEGNTFTIMKKNVKGYSMRVAIIAGGSAGEGNKQANGTFCASGYVIKNNTIKKSGAKKGIIAQHIQGTADSEITGNKIYLTKDASRGIQLENANIKSISNNVISSSGRIKGTGIYIRDSVVDYIGKKGKGNTISGCKGSGIDVREVTHVRSIGYNKIKNVNVSGISMKESYVTRVVGNSVKKSKRYGIFTEYTDTSDMNENKLSKCKYIGVYVGEGSRIDSTKENKITSTKNKGTIYEGKAVIATKPAVTLKKGKKRKLQKLVCNDVSEVKFWSSKKRVATIGANGKIEAHKKGKCKIIASYKGAKTTIEVKVK